jgi:alkylhydroperoxidase/carboxymuconolactone decarboxylase family protein YurZ
MSDGGSTTQLGSVRRRIEAVDRGFAEGLRRLAEVVRDDGALPAADKAVLMVAACSIGDPGSVAGEVGAALARGVTPEALRALAAALYLSRGEAPCRAVLTALDDSTDERPANGETVAAVTAVSEDEIVEEFRRVFGAVPDRVELLRRHSTAGLEAYHRMRVAVLRDGRLPPVLAELALVCVNAAAHRADFAAVHVAGARRAGATEPQLVEAGLCAVPSGGVAAWLAAAEAIGATQPDPPSPTQE